MGPSLYFLGLAREEKADALCAGLFPRRRHDCETAVSQLGQFVNVSPPASEF
jgi:hypothetical protein